MVQRKVPNKLSIEIDHVKSDKRLGNLKPPSSSSQHQDGKNRGADLKKKMKKSKSTKRSEFDQSFFSPPPTLKMPQPGKPPPHNVPKTAAAQPTKPLHGSPNYMKSTSSFEARKELIQFSSRSPQSGIGSKSPMRNKSNKSKLDSVSGHKQGRTLLRSSSLKLVRTLTRTPNFKPARSATKKCSQVVLCENLKAQRATCSSTLKDSKFPNYLPLSHGGTESEGTSVMKVCPYTYCSLNGHHHAPLPPLKCFLSARRRMLKAQKSVKLGCLSPRRAKPSAVRTKEIVDEKPIDQELDFISSDINPPIKEPPTDFFVEIYVKEGTAGAIDECKHGGDDQDMVDVSGGVDAVAEIEDGQAVESLSDDSLESQIDYDDNVGGNSDVTSTEIYIAGFFGEGDQNVEATEEVCPPFSAQEEASSKCLSNLEEESPASFGLDEAEVEVSDMEWEEGPHSAPYIDYEVDISFQINNIYDMEAGYSWEIDNSNIPDESDFKSDGILSGYLEEIPADEVQQCFFDKESESFEGWLSDGGSESDGSLQHMERDESIQVDNNQNHDQLSFSLDENQPGLRAAEERDGNTEADGFAGDVVTSALAEEPSERRAADEENHGESEADNGIPRMVLELGDDQSKCVSDKDDAGALMGYQQSDSSNDFTEREQDGRGEEYTESQNITEVYPSDAAMEKENNSEEVFDGSFSNTEDSDTGAEDGMADGQVEAAKSLDAVTLDFLQDLAEAEQDKTIERDDGNQLRGIAKDGESDQISVDEGLVAETQDHSSDIAYQSNAVENQDHPMKDQDAAEKSNLSGFMDSEEHTHSRMNLRSVENGNEDVAKMEVEERTEPDEENTCLGSKSIAGLEPKAEIFHSGSDHDQDLPDTCKNPRGTISRCKRANEDCDESRDFNPREPNYLPVEPEAEAEKVDLRHQMMDERKNSEEWMVDYALQQTVTKLAPARKRKVALLVEAFEAVMPIPKYESHLRHTPATFANVRPIQACN